MGKSLDLKILSFLSKPPVIFTILTTVLPQHCNFMFIEMDF